MQSFIRVLERLFKIYIIVIAFFLIQAVLHSYLPDKPIIGTITSGALLLLNTYVLFRKYKRRDIMGIFTSKTPDEYAKTANPVLALLKMLGRFILYVVILAILDFTIALIFGIITSIIQGY